MRCVIHVEYRRASVHADCMKLIAVRTSQLGKSWKIAILYSFFHLNNAFWYYFLKIQRKTISQNF